MVSNRGRKPGRGPAKSPLAEVNRNRRASRLAPGTYAEYPTDEEDLKEEEDDLQDSDFEADTRRGSPDTQQHVRLAQQRQHGGSKSGGKGSKKAVTRRSTRLSGPSVVPPYRGAGQGSGQRHEDSADEADEEEDDGEEDEEGEQREGVTDSPQVGRGKRGRQQQSPPQRQQQQGTAAGGAGGSGKAVGGQPARRASARLLSHQPPPQQDQHGNDDPDGDGAEDGDGEHGGGGMTAAQRDGSKDLRRSARLSHGTAAATATDSGGSGDDDDGDGAMGEDDSDGGGGPRKRRAAAAGAAARGRELPHANGHAGGRGAGERHEGDVEDEGDHDGDGEDEENDDDDGEEEGGVRKGRYHLRGHQVNSLRQHPAKRPRYSEEHPGEGANRRSGGRRDHDEDDDDEDGNDDEDGEEEDEEEDEEESRRAKRDLDRSRARDRDRRGGGSGGKAGGSKGQPVRYTLRDRSRMVPMSVQEQQRQQEELKQQMLARKRIRERSRGHGASGGKHGGGAGGGGGGGGGNRRSGGVGGWGWRGGVSDDDIPDIEGASGGNPWRSIHQAMGHVVTWQAGAPPNTPLPGQHVTAHGGAQVVPSSAAHGAGAQAAAAAAAAAAVAAAAPGPAGANGAFGGGGAPLAAWEQALLADAAALAAGGGAKEKAGNAEINPVAVDPSVGFDQVGGLDTYIDALKEMVFLPLVYPELFARFNVQPPRGVLFYGPPGTGKTLVARALAAHATRYGGRRVSFYMRKGADVLSKWVGEAERQLRLLFEEAQRNAPAIIFFDEIDGLAPVRSSRQDQIHNSIVSTLLALMDGLDSRGQVVVIGATNRPDALDGALRRPGRFDRELLFPLPGLQARRSILGIHTRKWSERPGPALLDELAGLCVGYCGADLKAVCAEAALHAVRRRYPQIYASEDKLLVEPSSVRVEREDFLAAIAAITPASNRSAAAHARPLSGGAAPCLAPRLATLLGRLQKTFPPAAQCLAAGAAREGGRGGPAAAAAAPSTSLILPPGRMGRAGGGAAAGGALQLPGGAAAGGALGALLSRLPGFLVSRPRLLLCGPAGCGQAQLAAALLYALEGLPAHAIGLPALLANPGARTPEEALVWAFVEARRSAPAILFLPHLQLWWRTAPPQLRATLVMLLRDLPPELPLLLLATADVPFGQLDREVRGSIFGAGEDVVALQPPSEQQRREVLQEPIMVAAEPVDPAILAADVSPSGAAEEAAAPLPKDPAVAAAREAEARSAAELAARRAYEDDQAALRALRMALRGVTLTLLTERRWKQFWAPVGPNEDPKYWEVVSSPMDLATILARVDGRQYATIGQYLADMTLIVQGAREYYEDSAREVSRATALADEAEHLVKARVPMDLAKRCEDMRARGGPAPPPPGLELPEELAAARAKAAAAARGGGAAFGTGSAGGAGPGPGGYVTRQRAGAGGQGGGHSDGPCIPMFDDPEALLRKTRLQQQQQQREREQPVSVHAGRSQAHTATGQHAGPRAEGDGPGPDAAADDAKEATSPPGRAPLAEDDRAQAGPSGAGGSSTLVTVVTVAAAADAHGRAQGALHAAPGDAMAVEANGGESGGAGRGTAEAGGAGRKDHAPAERDGDAMDVDTEAARAGLWEDGPGDHEQGRIRQPCVAHSETRTLPGTAAAGATGAGADAAAMDTEAVALQLAASGRTDAAAAADGTAPRARQKPGTAGADEGRRAPERDPQDPVALERARSLLERAVCGTAGWSLEALELLYTRAAAVAVEHARTHDRRQAVAALEEAVQAALGAGGAGVGGTAGGSDNARAQM